MTATQAPPNPPPPSPEPPSPEPPSPEPSSPEPAPFGYLAQELGEALVAARGTTSRRTKANELGIAHNTLREIELGQANPTLRRVEEICDRLDLTIEFRIRPKRRPR